MRYVVLAAFAAAVIVTACGCPQTAAPTQVTQTKLLDKYKAAGENPQLTIVYFTTGVCPADALRVRDLLKGMASTSEGAVRFVEVGDRDREGKTAYGIRTYPTILFFDSAGELKDRRGPDLTSEEAKEIVDKFVGVAEEPEPEPEEGAEEPEEPGDEPEEPEDQPEAPEDQPEEPGDEPGGE